jgi:predicted RNA binding protein YcfA (HicA-like mRNA interferase family)
MPKCYTSRELMKLAEEHGWRLVSITGDHHNLKHPESRFVVTIVHPQKDVPVGRTIDTVKKNQAGGKVMRFLIMLEQTEAGFAVQVPDLAIVTHGESIEATKHAAGEATQINLEAYRETG